MAIGAGGGGGGGCFFGLAPINATPAISANMQLRAIPNLIRPTPSATRQLLAWLCTKKMPGAAGCTPGTMDFVCWPGISGDRP